MILKTILTAGAAIALTTSVYAADYKLDPSHTSANFTVGHMGFSKTTGRFDEIEGSFTDTAGSESVNVTIKASSIDSNFEPRDKHLRSPDFFDVKQYPTITFKSTSVTKDKLVGELTMHGKTKPVTLDLEMVGEGDDPWGGYRKGYSATGTIKRSEWGINYGIPGISDEIELVLHVEGIRQ
ncbi:MAG: YceI family protein [Reinekea sp.]